MKWSVALAGVVGCMLVFSNARGQTTCPIVMLFALDGAAGDDFGAAVDVSGDVIVVGAPEDDSNAGNSSGSAYVFRFDGSDWVQEQKLTASDEASGDDYGFSVGVSGDTIVVGSPRDDTAAGNRAGSAYVYRYNAATMMWVEEAHLFAGDPGADDRFGHSVAIHGDTILAGAIQEDEAGSNAGAGYVFTRSGTVWSQQAKLIAAMSLGTNPQMGRSASLDGDVAVLGAWQDMDFSHGAAHVFRRAGTTWSEEQKLEASDTADFRWFGQSVSVSGATIAVGAFGDQAAGLSESGGAYFFSYDGGHWGEDANVNASDAAANDRFGWSIAVEGGNAVVGCGLSAPKAYLFAEATPGNWAESAMLNSIDPVVSAEYGYSVALSGNIAVIGDRNGMSTHGAAAVFGLVCTVCPWDCVGDDGLVGIDEFLAILGGWGGAGACDYDGDGVIGIAEFLKVLGTWGPCP